MAIFLINRCPSSVFYLSKGEEGGGSQDSAFELLDREKLSGIQGEVSVQILGSPIFYKFLLLLRLKLGKSVPY